MSTFAIFSTLPSDARIFVALGDAGNYAPVGDYKAGVAPADFETACRETVAELEASNRSFVNYGICAAKKLGDADRIARSIHECYGRARVEFRGDLEGLTLYLSTRTPEGARGFDAWSDVLHYHWIFVGVRFESPENEYGGVEAANRLVAAAALVVKIGLTS